MMQDDGWSTDQHAKDAMWGASGPSINDQPHFPCLATCFGTINLACRRPAIEVWLHDESNLATMLVHVQITSHLECDIGSDGRNHDDAAGELHRFLLIASGDIKQVLTSAATWSAATSITRVSNLQPWLYPHCTIAGPGSTRTACFMLRHI